MLQYNAAVTSVFALCSRIHDCFWVKYIKAIAGDKKCKVWHLPSWDWNTTMIHRLIWVGIESILSHVSVNNQFVSARSHHCPILLHCSGYLFPDVLVSVLCGQVYCDITQTNPFPCPWSLASPRPGQQQHWTQILGFVFVWILSPVCISLVGL